MAASLAQLPATAEKILAAFVEQLEAQGLSLPKRRYRSPTPTPVWDGEQFTVSLVGISQGQPGAQFGGTMHPSALNQTAMFSLNLIRKVSVIGEGPWTESIPTAAVIDKDGSQQLADAAALWAAAAEIHLLSVNGQPGGITDPGEGFEQGPIQPLGPEGGLAGTRLLISLTVL